MKTFILIAIQAAGLTTLITFANGAAVPLVSVALCAMSALCAAAAMKISIDRAPVKRSAHYTYLADARRAKIHHI